MSSHFIEMNDPALDGDIGGLGAVKDVKFREDVLQAAFHGGFR